MRSTGRADYLVCGINLGVLRRISLCDPTSDNTREQDAQAQQYDLVVLPNSFCSDTTKCLNKY